MNKMYDLLIGVMCGFILIGVVYLVLQGQDKTYNNRLCVDSRNDVLILKHDFGQYYKVYETDLGVE